MTYSSLRTHWFFLAAPLILAVNLYAALSSRGDISPLIEFGLLFDLAVLVPCLYWLCYRAQGRKAIIKAAALACLGIWIALKLVPEEEQWLLGYVAPLRYVGLAALIWLEVVVMVAIYRSVFKGNGVEDTAAKVAPDMPPWMVRLLAMEAAFWAKVWRTVKQWFGRR